MAIRTKPTESMKTHHVSFEQSSTKLGLVLCDGKGNPDPTAFREGRMPNRAMQFSQGDPDYSDMELPYTPITQKNWSGGRGNEDFENDTSRYSDANAIDALSGNIILAPKPTEIVFETTPSGDQQPQTGSSNIPSPNYWTTAPYPLTGYHLGFYMVSDKQYVSAQIRASAYVPASTYYLDKIKFWFKGTNKVRISIFKYPTINLSTSQAVTAFNNACRLGTANPTYGIDVVHSNEFSIVEASELTQYTFDMKLKFESGIRYVIAVCSLTTYVAPPSISPYLGQSNAVIYWDSPFWFGTYSVSSSLEFMSLYGTHNAGSFLNNEYNTYDGEFGIALRYTSLIDDAYSGQSLAFVLVASLMQPGSAHFFKYRNTLFMVTSPADGTAPRLFYEGYHGWASSNAADMLKIMAADVGEEAIGATVKVIAGSGYTERTRWRRITGVDTVNGTYVTVYPAWNITHSATTEYTIFGTGKWKEITGHGLNKEVTDVLVVNDIIYFCMDGEQYVRRMRMVNSAGAWSPEYANEAFYATFMKLIQDEKGVQYIWRANANAVQVSKSEVKTWGTALSFGTSITCGNTMYRITGLVAYGTPRIPYVMKEDGFGAIANDIYDQVPLSEFESVADDNNGRANLQRGLYLYLSLLNGVERYYEGRLDDIGANRDQGLPNDRNGNVSFLLAYPGRMYASIDHPTGYSSVLVYNDMGWHEIYRSSQGARIYSLHVQVIDGDVCDRLWVAQAASFVWLPIAIDPKKQSDYAYNSTGELETSWISGNFKEIIKYYSSIIVYSEGLSSGQYVQVSFKVDSDDNDWTLITTNVNQSPSQEISFPNHETSGKRIKIKLSLFTNDSTKTPRIKGITIKPVTRLPIKNSWSMTYRVDDNQFDLQGSASTLTAEQLQAQIKAWANSNTSPLPLLMNAPYSLFDSKYVFIEPDSLRPIQEVYNDDLEKFVGIGQLTVFEAE